MGDTPVPEVERLRRMPRLEPPFAILGAVAGWTTARLLENRLIDVSRSLPITFAMLGGAAGGATVGYLLVKWTQHDLRRQIRHDWENMRPYSPATWLRLALTLGLGGLLVGMLVGGFTPPYQGGTEGAGFGLLAGLALVPLGRALLATAERAQRARLGSIVAHADRRSLWGMLATAIAMVSLGALLEWPAWRGGVASLPWVAAAATVGPAAVLVAELVANLAAARRIHVAVRGTRDRDHDLAAPPSGVPRLDLGVGDALRAQVAAGGGSYRQADREVALVIGDPADATRALRRANLIAAGRLGLVLLVGAAHGYAQLPGHALRYEAALCERRFMAECGRTALLLEARDGPTAKSIDLLGVACRSFDSDASCEHLAELASSSPQPLREYAVDALYASCRAYSRVCCMLEPVFPPEDQSERAVRTRGICKEVRR
jgi:hypothetical protein